MSKSTAALDKYFSDITIPSSVNKSDIRSIRDWLKKQAHIPELTDRQIAIFLHSCFGALELTKITIDSYYTIRTHAPELFNGRTPEEVAETSNVVYCVLLDQVCPDGCRILVIGFTNPDPAKFHLTNSLRYLVSMLDIMYNQNSFDEGIRIVYDFTGTSFGHLAKFNISTLKKTFTYLQTIRIALSILDIEGNLTPYATGWRLVINAKGFSLGHFTRLTANIGLVKKILYYVQDGLPLRLRGIHIFNAIPLINQFLAVIRPIMKKELYQLINVHSTNDMESMFPYIPQECLPSNYGGKAPTVEELMRSSNEKMEKYKKWFVDDDRLGRVDESKRAGKAKNSGDIFGFDGSFKKLDFD